MKFIFHYPDWYVALCLAVAVATAALLYVRSRQLSEVPAWLKWVMAGLRTAAVFLICILLLAPLIESTTEEVEKPVIVVAHDNSRSLLLGSDSAFVAGEYLPAYDRFIARLQGHYRTDAFLFGETFRQGSTPDLQDAETDISDLFVKLFDRYYNRNVGAIVVASDGIWNKGQDPTYLAERFPGIPIYTIALGDTTVRRDALLEKINHNPTAYLGNEFPVEVLVRAQDLEGKNSKVRILKGGRVLAETPVAYNRKLYLQTLGFTLKADVAGLQHYVVEVVPVEGEFTEKNNRLDVYIQVISSRQKILLLSHAPHPDIAPLRDVLEKNSNYETDVALASEFSGVASAYSLIILHQLPSRAHPVQELLRQAKASSTPVAVIAGASSDFGALNNLNIGVNVQGYRGNYDVVTPVPADGFNLFTLSSAARRSIPDLPPAHVPFGIWKFSEGVQPFIMQRLGRVVKNEPLIALNVVNETRYGIVCGEGVWRWRLKDPEVFEEIFGKFFQYLTTRQNRDPFRLYADDRYMENQSVVFEAEVYNQSYELITEPRVKMLITDEGGKEFPFDFQVSGNHYRLDAGKLKPGTYTFKATADVYGKTYVQTGEFSVQALQAEQLNVTADHGLLFTISSKSGARLVYPGDLDKLADELIDKQVPGEVHQEQQFDPVMDWRWIFFILMVLLGAEWYLRKRYGAY
jgi:hypothetical protein